MYPGIRLGFVVLPSSLMGVIRELKICMTGPAPTFMQHAMAEFIFSGDYQRHLNRVRKVYAERRARLLESIRARLGSAVRWHGSSGGVHLYVELARAVPDRAFRQTLSRAQVAVTVFPATGRGGSDGVVSQLALGYGGIHADAIDAGMEAFSAAVKPMVMNRT
jgi:GntR family transcriptional regulator/MocR family aminotransferase